MLDLKRYATKWIQGDLFVVMDRRNGKQGTYRADGSRLLGYLHLSVSDVLDLMMG